MNKLLGREGVYMVTLKEREVSDKYAELDELFAPYFENIEATRDDKVVAQLSKEFDIEVRELQKYSTTPYCTYPKAGMEDEYNRIAEKVRALSKTKNKIFFGMVFKDIESSEAKKQ